MDCVYDLTDLLMLGPLYLLIPHLYKPVTERHPYGFAQVESLFIIIKTGILIFITGQLILESIQMIMNGGHLVHAGFVAGFELFVSLTCFIMFIVLSRLKKQYSELILGSKITPSDNSFYGRAFCDRMSNNKERRGDCVFQKLQYI
jgi:predicted Co/Zn/Cd cation transporter (cation efflux family)